MTFKLRYDWQATREGMQGGLSFQSTEWEEFQSGSWKNAIERAKEKLWRATPNDPFSPNKLQGCALMRKKNLPTLKIIGIKISP